MYTRKAFYPNLLKHLLIHMFSVFLGFGCGPDGSLQDEEICESDKHLWAG
jgi:hypothetical protein